MTKELKNIIKNNRKFITFYLMWLLFHLTVLVNSRLFFLNVNNLHVSITSTLKLKEETVLRVVDKGIPLYDMYYSHKFWPFGTTKLKYYDKTEFVFYSLLPIIIYFIWKLNSTYMNKKISALNKLLGKRRLFKRIKKSSKGNWGKRRQMYFYKQDGEILGPVPIDDLIKVIKSDTMICLKENKEQWMPAMANKTIRGKLITIKL